MDAFEIIAKIIDMHKDVSFEEVQDLIESRVNISDFGTIYDGLIDHVSSNEMNAADYALDVISGYRTTS